MLQISTMTWRCEVVSALQDPPKAAAGGPSLCSAQQRGCALVGCTHLRLIHLQNTHCAWRDGDSTPSHHSCSPAPGSSRPWHNLLRHCNRHAARATLGVMPAPSKTPEKTPELSAVSQGISASCTTLCHARARQKPAHPVESHRWEREQGRVGGRAGC